MPSTITLLAILATKIAPRSIGQSSEAVPGAVLALDQERALDRHHAGEDERSPTARRVRRSPRLPDPSRT